MANIPASVRRFVTERARFRCEYCQAQQIVVVTLVLDHILPQVLGGETVSENLCLSCIGCNGHKHVHTVGIDADSGREFPLFHPRKQKWDEHFQWDATKIKLTGLTPTGRATIQRLRINREDMLISRQHWLKAGWHPPK